MKQLGARLKQCREAAGMKQSEVAVQLRVTRQAVSAWEAGSRKLTAIQLGRIAAMLETSADYLLTGVHMVPAPNGSPMLQRIFGGASDIPSILSHEYERNVGGGGAAT